MNNGLPILGIETSGELCSVALLVNETTFYEINILEKHVHSKKILNLIDILLKEAGIELTKLSHIAVSIGPGSFTGLRIGLTTAKGIGFGSNLPIVPVPTFNAMALQVSDFIPDNSNFAIVKNASMDDIYFAIFHYDGKGIRSINELSLVKKNEIEKKITNTELVFSDVVLNIPSKKVIGPDAYNICRYSYLFGKDLLTFDYDYLEPFYLKQFLTRVKK
jgi:tRNA threonylcarbamoyladenosine biosynthesis protein TsaB